jgi:hypothetical protein
MWTTSAALLENWQSCCRPGFRCYCLRSTGFHLQLRRVANGYEQRARGSGLWGRRYRQWGVSSWMKDKGSNWLLASIWHLGHVHYVQLAIRTVHRHSPVAKGVKAVHRASGISCVKPNRSIQTIYSMPSTWVQVRPRNQNYSKNTTIKYRNTPINKQVTKRPRPRQVYTELTRQIDDHTMEVGGTDR